MNIQPTKTLLFQRRGTTIVEVLVCMAVISGLLAISLPAVLEARMSARKLQCINNLRQHSLALANFSSAHGHYPLAWYVRLPVDHQAQPGVISVQAQLLPHLEQAALFERISFRETAIQGYPFPASNINPEIISSRIPVFQCPDDSSNVPLNYRVCRGVLSGQFEHRQRGVFDNVRATRPADITDGLSNTMIMSERSGGDGDDSRLVADRDVVLVNFDELASNPDVMSDICLRGAARPISQIRHASNCGRTWLLNGLAYTWYVHTLTPNSVIPDCSRSGHLMADAAVSARSSHRQGVCSALADGSARFVASSIDVTVWRSLATRAGGEPVHQF